MFYTLDQAVKVTGLSKSKILKALECGQITGAKDLFGEWQIEHRELHQIYPPLVENADKDGTQTSVAPDAAALEAEIAALIKEAGESLRGQPGDRQWNTGQIALRPLAADPNEADEYSATPPKNIDFKVKEACLERRAWDPDIRISDPERISDSSPDAQGTRTALVAGALLGTVGIGWIFGLVPHFFDSPGSIPVEQRVHSLAQVLDSKNQTTFGSPETGREATPGVLNTDKIATLTPSVPARRLDSTQSAAQPNAIKTSAVAQQNTGSSGPAASGVGRGPKILPRQMPFPETGPNTIEGWKVRDVVGGTAILEGPDGVWRATRGDTVPGVGRVESIVRWGSRWIVATSRGLISMP